MTKKIVIPAFASEADEAQWWYDHREETGRAMVEASQQGRNGIGTLGRAKLREEAEARAQAEQTTSTPRAA